MKEHELHNGIEEADDRANADRRPPREARNSERRKERREIGRPMGDAHLEERALWPIRGSETSAGKPAKTEVLFERRHFGMSQNEEATWRTD